ncbi:MAG: N-acetylmuramoyl-L-alanine amidase, partial [Bacteroidota bacterium]
LLFLCGLQQINAQTPVRTQLNLTVAPQEKSTVHTIPIVAQPFLAYYLTQAHLIGTKQAYFQMRFSKDASTWTDWETLTSDGHLHPEDLLWSSELYFLDKTYRYYQYQWTGLSVPEKVKLHFYSPDDTPTRTANTMPPKEQTVEARGACPCLQPSVQGRSDWCDSCPRSSSPSPHYVTHLIVHHSAGTNVADDWAAIVRSVWDFHVEGRGWADIGYNWLIDPNGVIYEGRATNIRGAHFCGNNTNTEGVCMLGDFTEIVPTDTSQQSLTQLLAWKACGNRLNPVGTRYHGASSKVLDVISGHRDGCATNCPGDSFYPLLPNLREAVQAYQDTACTLVHTDEPELEAIRIAPNPVQDYLNIRLPNSWKGVTTLQWRSTSGQLIKEKTILTNGHHKVGVGDMSAGVYLLSIRNNSHQKSFRIIKH